MITAVSHDHNIQNSPRVILGSRSPRRKELLGSIVGHDQLVIKPPVTPEEPGFLGLHQETEIEHRLLDIVQLKHSDVCQQIAADTSNEVFASVDSSAPFVVVADTIVVAELNREQRMVLGQPEPDRWQDDVREWLRHRLSNQSHEVWTGVLVSQLDQTSTCIVKSAVTFCEIDDELIEWYVSTRESLGKAGGYAIQGFAGAFVTQLRGSLTNVIGLPVMETRQALINLGWKSSP
jgi:septum formation protein